MSSFRIERQYVSFKTVETPNVHPVEQAIRSGGKGDYAGQKNGCCATIIERAQTDAEKRADQILKRAEKEGKRIVGTAKAQADEIIEEARKSAENIREKARAEGYALGIRNAGAEAEARRIAEAEKLRQMIEKLRSDYSGLLESMQQDIKSLVAEIARKIINVKLQESDKVFIGLINDAIDKLKQTGYLIIRVCPEDYARYFGGDAEGSGINAGEAKVIAVEEETFAPGDLIIESQAEMLNLSVERQIRQVEKALSE